MFVPLSGEEVTREIKVKLKPSDTGGGEVARRASGERLDTMAAGLTEVQSLLASGQAPSALAKLNVLQNDFSEMKWLNFLRASCLVVLDRREEAKAVLEIALKEYPKDPAGAELYRILSGGNEKRMERLPASAPSNGVGQ